MAHSLLTYPHEDQYRFVLDAAGGEWAGCAVKTDQKNWRAAVAASIRDGPDFNHQSCTRLRQGKDGGAFV